jgi:hypothetical protein
LSLAAAQTKRTTIEFTSVPVPLFPHRACRSTGAPREKKP